MLLAIFNLDTGVGAQIGAIAESDDYYYIRYYRYGYSRIPGYGAWPNSWETSAGGTYTATWDISGLAWSGSRNYKICIKNSFDESPPYLFSGTFSIDASNGPPLTSPPTAIPTLDPKPKPKPDPKPKPLLL
jgi:hypothetical protein